MRGAKTVAVDATRHVAYVFTPEYGPALAGALMPANGRATRGPMIGAWLITVGR